MVIMQQSEFLASSCVTLDKLEHVVEAQKGIEFI